MTLNVIGSIVQKKKRLIVKKRNSIKGLMSVHYFYMERPNKIECCINKVSWNVIHLQASTKWLL